MKKMGNEVVTLISSPLPDVVFVLIMATRKFTAFFFRIFCINCFISNKIPFIKFSYFFFFFSPNNTNVLDCA